MGETRAGGGWGFLKNPQFSPQNKRVGRIQLPVLGSTDVSHTDGGVWGTVATKDSRSPNVSADKSIVCYRKRIKCSTSIKAKIYVSVPGGVTARGQERPRASSHCLASVRAMARCTCSLRARTTGVRTEYSGTREPMVVLTRVSDTPRVM